MSFFGKIYFVQGFGGVHITNRHVAFFPQRVIAQVVLLEVIKDIPIGPVGNGSYVFLVFQTVRY
jgi:hypothetical protein